MEEVFAMKTISSYGVQVKRCDADFKETLAVYRKAIAFLIDCVEKEWSSVVAIKGKHAANQRQGYIERLVHGTKNRVAKYTFDQKFPKFPSYLRRAAITEAIGAVSSYHSNHANWVDNGKQGKEPTLQMDRFAMPTFYKKAMFLTTSDPYTVHLKLYHKNDWVWVPVRLLKTDVKYLQKHWNHVTPSAPTLERRRNHYCLRFAFEESVQLYSTPLEKQRICAVDLGLNTDAVCSIMSYDGTVHARKFIDFPCEKDHLGHVLNRIKKYQREHGSHNVGGFWAYARRINDEHAKKIAGAIIQFTAIHDVDCIVFEHLNFTGRKLSGSKAQKLSMWKRNSIQDYVEHTAHRCGIHISRVCAWGTSKLAFDGSGEVTRDEKNRALAAFSSGKQYNCDLSASYNIGARYFIRERTKTLPVTVRSSLEAKVPLVKRRTSCTLDTLRCVHTALAAA
jgi:transposase